MTLGRRLLDLLYPPRCVYCNGLLDAASWEPCSRCRDTLPWTAGEGRLWRGDKVSLGVAAGFYEGDLRASLLRFKFSGKKAYGAAYARPLADCIREALEGRFDVLSWVPVSPDTLARRGYDQARVLAEETGKLLGVTPVATLDKVGRNAPQSSLPHRGARWQNVAGVYAPREGAAILGRRILLVDDIFTTGATLEEAGGTLLAAGAAQVTAAVVCRGGRQGEG